MKENNILIQLRNFDTPSITNVVATYPGNPLCLEIYNPWQVNWYTDSSIKCMFPELYPLAGYAVTCIYGPPDSEYNKYTFMVIIN